MTAGLRGRGLAVVFGVSLVACVLLLGPLGQHVQAASTPTTFTTSGGMGVGSASSALAVASTPPAAKAGGPPTIHAKAAFLIDMNTGQVLDDKNGDARRSMASTTKMMTCLLVLQTLPLDRTVTVSARAASVGEETLGLKTGDRLTVEQLLYGLMVKSANDAAIALAEASAGSEQAFVQKMNEEARALGLKDTHYTSAHGLDAKGHYSSARDLATLARYAMQNEEFRALVGTVSYTLTIPGRTTSLTFRNINKLVGTVNWVTGVKTGFTNQAGFCLVASGTKDGVSLISVVMGEGSWAPCWADSKALLEYGFSRFAGAGASAQPAPPPSRVTVLIRASDPVAETPIPYHFGAQLPLLAENTVQAMVSVGEQVRSKVTVERAASPPLVAGQVMGRVDFTVEGRPVGTVPLVAAVSIGRVTLGQKLVYFWHRFTSWLGRVF